MIPKKLEITGLYSYQEIQVIDFEKLAAAGLFGIFGAVGSGKSSILEAILLALYGSTERLSITGERNSMVNLQSDHILINFEFSAGSGNKNLFLARYAAKRNKKNPEKIDTGEHGFYLNREGKWEALDQGAEQILGMKKEHFKQTVIIPQGKFREFIDLKPKDQSDMMKELFGLQRFDLSFQNKALKSQVEKDLIRLNTKLESLEEINSDNLKELEEEVKAITDSIAESEKAHQKKSDEYKGLEKIQSLKKEHENLKKEQAELLSQKPEIDEEKKQHERYLTARNKIRPAWEKHDEIKSDLEKNQVSLVESQRWADDYKRDIAELEKNLAKLKEKNDDRPNREAKIRDCRRILDVQSLQIQKASIVLEAEKISPAFDAKKESIESHKVSLKKFQVEQNQNELPSTEKITEWNSWIVQQKSIDEQKVKLEETISRISSDYKGYQESIKEIMDKVPAKFPELLDWKKSIEKEIGEKESEKENLKNRIGIGAHVHILEDGKPCPLCGSTEHPEPVDTRESEDELNAIAANLTVLQAELDEIVLLQRKAEEFTFKSTQISKAIEERKVEMETLLNQSVELISKAKEVGFGSMSELAEKLNSLKVEIQEREQRQTKIDQILNAIEREGEELKSLESKTNTLQSQIGQIESSIITKKGDFHDSEFCEKHLQTPADTIQGWIVKVNQDIEEASQNFDGAQKNLLEQKQKETINSTNLSTYKSNVESLKKQIESAFSVLQSLQVRHGFEDENELKALFELQMDEERIAQKIRSFEDRLNFLNRRLSELEAENSFMEFDESHFLSLRQELQSLKEDLEDQKTKAALLSNQIKITKEKLRDKEELTQELEKKEKRQTYLKELDRLFMGNGFVKYVSSIYLRELCQTANLRFMKLTKNQLSLDIDGNNTFWVIDYLNGGKKRLLKTLSGGQTFQASLCLALALAEKIKALNQADQSFFFMDEGFGALDKNSLQVVFDTLKSLRFENRIVGIISHVEELQQEIGVYAKVELDSEIGSQVSYSFQ